MPVLRPLIGLTRTRSPPRRSGSARTRSRSSPTRTAARCSRRGIRRRRADARATSSARRRELDDRGARRGARSRRRSWRTSDFPMVRLSRAITSRRSTIVKITPGKLAGMKAVSDERGVIAAAAMDQRGSLQKSLAKEKGGDVGDAMMEEFKTLVTEVLTPHASAILLDPEWGIPASQAAREGRRPAAGLREDRLRRDRRPGRLPDLLDDWSVRRLKEAGADCIKILLYYTPFDPKADQRPQARVGRAHRRRVPRQRHPVLPRVHRLRGRRRREGPGVREEEARASSRAAWRSSRRIATASTC